MDPIVQSERLGKRYEIRHERNRQQYVALRDVLTAAVEKAVVLLAAKPGPNPGLV